MDHPCQLWCEYSRTYLRVKDRLQFLQSLREAANNLVAEEVPHLHKLHSLLQRFEENTAEGHESYAVVQSKWQETREYLSRVEEERQSAFESSPFAAKSGRQKARERTLLQRSINNITDDDDDDDEKDEEDYEAAAAAAAANSTHPVVVVADNICVICKDQPSCVLSLPCQHCRTCLSCTAQLLDSDGRLSLKERFSCHLVDGTSDVSCPVCRSPVATLLVLR